MLGAAGGRDAAEIQLVLPGPPAEVGEQSGDGLLGGGSSPERNTVLGPLSALGLVIRVAGTLLRVLTTLASREGRLDLLREARVGVGELPLGGDRERDVDEDLAGERWRADLTEDVERGPARDIWLLMVCDVADVTVESVKPVLAKRYREMPVPDGNLIEACISLIATMNL